VERIEGEEEAAAEKRIGEALVGDGYPCSCNLAAPADLSILPSVNYLPKF
jgi:hypothetical protein